MTIDLSDIPEEGKIFQFNRNTGELNDSLRDLIKSRPYSAEVFIRPLTGGTFEMTGFIRTDSDELCSRCGIDFEFPINETFKELVMPTQGVPRDAKFSKANHFSELNTDAPDVVEYVNHRLEVGEFLHEIVALAIPFNPAPPVQNEKCQKCLIPMQEHAFDYDENFEKPESPFSVLKKMNFGNKSH